MTARGCTLALALALVPTSAHATWSIVGVDPRTQEVGVAVASCVEAPWGTDLLPQVPALAPGIGALAAQAQLNQQTRDYALMLLESGIDAQGVIDMTNAMDFGAQTRQYGVVRLAGDTATFTGSQTSDWAGDLQSTNVTAQGNILYGPEVVGDAMIAFEAEPRECPWTLADRLMVALEAGAAQGGDNRCSIEQSALVAVLQVAKPTDVKGSFTIDLLIPSQPQGGQNPVVMLRAAYDEWRAMNPPDDSGCMPGGESTGGERTTEGSDGGTGSGGGVDESTGGEVGGGTTTAGGSSGAGESAGGSSDGTSGAAEGGEGSSGGCSCRATGGPSAALLLLAAGARPRRRRTSQRRASSHARA